MPAPTTLAVSVDNSEYCRYESDKKTITATVVATAPTFVGEEILVELVKARRNRDAVVAQAVLTFVGGSPQRQVATFYLPELVDQDEIHLTRHGKYLVRATYEAVAASASVGSGPDGTILLTAGTAGSSGNSLTVEVAVPAGTSPVAITRAGDAITVSLNTVSGVATNDVYNSAAYLSALITNTLPGIVATYTGTGSTALTLAEGPTTFTGGEDAVTSETDDFRITMFTVDRLKNDYLFGLPLSSALILQPKYQPAQFNDALTITSVSQGHPMGFHTLTYDYQENHTSNATVALGSGANGTLVISAVDALAGTAGNAVSVEVVVPVGTSGLSASLTGTVLVINLAVSGGVPVAASNRVFQIADLLNTIDNLSSTFTGTGVDSLSAAVPATLFTGGATTEVRTLSWNGGPVVSITGPGRYLLRRGAGAGGVSCGGNNPLSVFGVDRDYVEVRVTSDVLLPTTPVTEEILIDRREIDDETLQRYIDAAIDWLEEVELAVRLEPTNITTDIDASTLQYSAGIGLGAPIFTDSDFDFVVSPLTYFIGKNNQEWMGIQTPYMSILRVDNLFGAIATTRVIDIDLDWIHFYEVGGLIQLVPFNQQVAFDYIGLIWSSSLRGPVALPNFWHFNMIVGLRECPAVLREVIGKKAAIDALTALGQAFRPGVGSTSLSRDGVSESISYTTQSQYGIYTGTITAYKEFISENLQKFRGKYRGATMVVV